MSGARRPFLAGHHFTKRPASKHSSVLQPGKMRSIACSTPTSTSMKTCSPNRTGTASTRRWRNFEIMSSRTSAKSSPRCADAYASAAPIPSRSARGTAMRCSRKLERTAAPAAIRPLRCGPAGVRPRREPSVRHEAVQRKHPTTTKGLVGCAPKNPRAFR